MGSIIPKCLRQEVLKLWNSGVLLRSILADESYFPKRLSFKKPNTQELVDRFDEVRKWIAEIKAHHYPDIDFKTINHRILGENTIPCGASIPDLESAVKWLGKFQAYQQFSKMITYTRQFQPELLLWLEKYPLKALEIADDWSRLLKVIDWLKKNPNPNIYLRQVDIATVDTKFIERNKALLVQMLPLVLTERDLSLLNSRNFEKQLGFKTKPLFVRFRLLDQQLQFIFGRQQDFTLADNDFKELISLPQIQQSLKNVFITENEINFLSFPQLANSMVIFGAGYGFDHLAKISWLNDMNIYYWGDIDTHGFAILDQLRAKFPRVKSILMDQETLLAHSEFWGVEPKPEHRKLLRLTVDEEHLYQQLVGNIYTQNLRLEQEKISYSSVMHAIAKLSNGSR
ncbi:MAG: DUF2220 family protein [Proteobacteria bacterium]|nr:DUF2220 family protein [Pseudomonadota bacterium]